MSGPCPSPRSPASAAHIELLGSSKLEVPGEIQPRLVQTFNFDIPGDSELYTVTSGNSLRGGEQVTVSGTWDPPVIAISVRLVKDDGSRAITAPLTTTSSYTFTVPVTGIYSIQVAARYDIEGILMVEW